jgi:hypothetical protein
MTQMFYGATNFNNSGLANDTSHPMGWIVTQFPSTPVYFSVGSNLTFNPGNSPFSSNGYVPDVTYSIQIICNGTTEFNGRFLVNGANFVTDMYSLSNPSVNVVVYDYENGATYIFNPITLQFEGGTNILATSMPSLSALYNAIEYQLTYGELFYKTVANGWNNPEIPNVVFNIAPYAPAPCFKEGSKILTDRGYVPVQNLKRGDLVKTLHSGYKAVDIIGKRDIHHHAVKDRIKNQLYTCSSTEYPELIEDLVITGCHSILVSDLKEGQRETIVEVLGKIYITEQRYRLPACIDDRASVYEIPGDYTIYHIALENDNYYWNYGIYANGLLVESCSKRYLKELSGMDLY